MIVFDASGSMWGQVDGTAKIDIARDVFTDLSADWVSAGQAVGLVAYGHRRKGDCSDIELLTTPSTAATTSLAEVVNGLTPRGKTPLSQAVRMAAEELGYTENAATVVLLSDGKETCDLDPCDMGAKLEQLGVNFTAHVIGFDIGDAADKAQLQCLAEGTGGTYVDARDSQTLSRALTNATTTADTPNGTTSTHVTLAMAGGTARPAIVTLNATSGTTGEVRELGTLEGADQVLTGLKIDVPHGNWTFSAQGDGGAGEIEVALNEASQEVSIPFAAGSAVFELTSAGRFATDGTILFQLRSLKPLQQNATYSVMLFPKGATEYDQSVTYTSRFGSDADETEHQFYPWEYELSAGEYEIIIMGDSYDLADHLGRFPVTLVEAGSESDAIPEPEGSPENAAPSFTLAQLIEPLSPGMGAGLLVSGPIAANDQVIFIGLDGQQTQIAGVPESGLVLVPPRTEPGTYRLQLLREDGSDYHLDLIDILPNNVQDIGDHSDSGEAAETMLSEEELAAENGDQSLPFTIWESCVGDAPCRVADPRVALEWAMPPGWASEEPFYYTTAAGAQADHSTVHMARAMGGAFVVVLNPRQRDAQLGLCEEVPKGLLCHETTDDLRDQTDFELIRNSFHGDLPKPEGWLPLDRSWTIEDKIMGGQVGLLKITEPAERAETIKVQLMLSNPTQFGITDTSIVAADLALTWDNRETLLRAHNMKKSILYMALASIAPLQAWGQELPLYIEHNGELSYSGSTLGGSELIDMLGGRGVVDIFGVPTSIVKDAATGALRPLYLSPVEYEVIAGGDGVIENQPDGLTFAEDEGSDLREDLDFVEGEGTDTSEDMSFSADEAQVVSKGFDGPSDFYTDPAEDHIYPKHGTWSIRVNNTEVIGCPPGVGELAAAQVARTETTKIEFSHPGWRPSDLGADYAQYQWTPVGKNGYFAEPYSTGAQAMGSGLSLSVTTALSAKSEMQIDVWARVLLNLTPMLARMAGGSETCTATVTGTYTKS